MENNKQVLEIFWYIGGGTGELNKGKKETTDVCSQPYFITTLWAWMTVALQLTILFSTVVLEGSNTCKSFE